MQKFILSLLVLVPITLFSQAPPTTIQEAAIEFLNYAEGQITQLAEAIPEDKYDWRPAEGVRSVSESIMHTAGANYFIVMTAGHTPPEGVDIMGLEKSVTGKENVLEALKASYEYAREGIKNISKKDLQETVEFPFPGEYNKLSSLLIVTGHSHEHLGQLIAYARMNGIVPPWSE